MTFYLSFKGCRTFSLAEFSTNAFCLEGSTVGLTIEQAYEIVHCQLSVEA